MSNNMTSIHISGPDASSFLQGQCTCDIESLDQEALLTACCNQKGRMIANFWIWREGDDFYLQLPAAMVDKLIAHLQTYQLRSKVSFEPIENTSKTIKPDFPLIWILPETSEQFTPQMIDLQKHGGVSFTKGCYLGQEIIARTEHLGQLKRHLYEITLEKEMTPTVGDEIKNADSQKMGTVVAITDQGLFAVLEDRAIKTPLYLANVLVVPTEVETQN